MLDDVSIFLVSWLEYGEPVAVVWFSIVLSFWWSRSFSGFFILLRNQWSCFPHPEDRISSYMLWSSRILPSMVGVFMRLISMLPATPVIELISSLCYTYILSWKMDPETWQWANIVIVLLFFVLPWCSAFRIISLLPLPLIFHLSKFIITCSVMHLFLTFLYLFMYHFYFDKL